MNELETMLRARYRSPKEVARALGLDAAILREPGDNPKARAVKAGVQAMLAEDSLDPNDLIEFLIDHIKADKARTAEAEGKDDTDVDEEEEREDDDLQRLEREDDNDGEAGEEEDDMEANSGLPVNAGEREEKKEAKDGGDVNRQVAEMLMKCAKLLSGEGHEEHEEHAIDEEIDGEDCAAKDEDLEERKKEAKDEEPKGLKEKTEKELITKPAMDAAISAAVKAAEKRSRENAKAIRAAERAVRPYVGELAMDAASPDEVYRKALGMMGIEGAETVHASALPILLKTLPLPGSNAAPRREVKIAQDAAAVDARAKRFPVLARIAH